MCLSLSCTLTVGTHAHGQPHPRHTCAQAAFFAGVDGRAGLGWLLRDALSAEYDIARTYYLIGQASPQFVEAYLMVMGYNLTDISDYVELAKLYRKLEG